jgi:hypothetical protein
MNLYPYRQDSSSVSSVKRLKKSFLLIHSWSWALLEKLPIVQLLRELPSILWNPEVHHRVHISPPPVPILSQIDPIPTIPSYLFKIHFNIVHPSTSCQGIRPGPRLRECFRNKLIFYGEELLAPRPTPKLEDHPLSDVRDCLFNIFEASLHNCRASPPSATWGRTMPWWQGTHLIINIYSLGENVKTALEVHEWITDYSLRYTSI